MKRILGVDPGTWKTGAGLLDLTGNQFKLVHAEIITVTQQIPLAQRLLIIFRSLSEIIRKYRPEVLALENIFYHKDVRAMIKIGEARACAMLAASEHGIPVLEYLPTTVKQAVTGNGRASKAQVQLMMQRLLGVDKNLEYDATDALAVALCHANSQRAWKETAAPEARKRSRVSMDKQWLEIAERNKKKRRVVLDTSR